MDVIDRFLKNVEWSDQRHAGTRCLQWVGYIDRAGYASMSDARKTRRSHRWIYERWLGPIPAGLELDHLCRNRGCVNPDHLEPVTHAENQRRMGVARTHCPHGHAYTPENIYLQNGFRTCRECKRVRDRARYWREKNR